MPLTFPQSGDTPPHTPTNNAPNPEVSAPPAFPSHARLDPLLPFAARWREKREDHDRFVEAVNRANERLPAGFRLPDVLIADWLASWADDLFIGVLPGHDRLTPEEVAGSMEDIAAIVEAVQFVERYPGLATAERLWFYELKAEIGLPHFAKLEEVRRHRPELDPRRDLDDQPGDISLTPRLDQALFFEAAAFLLGTPTEEQLGWIRRLAYRPDPLQRLWPDPPRHHEWVRSVLRRTIPELTRCLGVDWPELNDSLPLSELVRRAYNWVVNQARPALARRATSGASGRSVSYRLAELRDLGQQVEAVAVDYHAALRPLREALQAVADAPLQDRERWGNAVYNLADQLVEEGMGDIPASLRDSPRWGIAFEAGQPARAVAGEAFCDALSNVIANGSSPSGFFAACEQYPFMKPDKATREIRAVLSQLLYRRTHPAAQELSERLEATFSHTDMCAEMLQDRLAQCEMPLSNMAIAAIRASAEYRTGVPFYDVDIRPTTPTSEGETASNGPSSSAGHGQPNSIPDDELVSRFHVDPPRDLDRELGTAFSAVAIGIRECLRLIASIPHLWKNEGEYRRLATCVAEAAVAARKAYMEVDIRLRRAGGPNTTLDALNDVLTVRDRAPLEPTAMPGGLNAILTRLYTTRSDLFLRIDGQGILHRILDQLARVPIAVTAAPAPATTTGRRQDPRSTKKAGKPVIPDRYRKAVALWPAFRKEMDPANKRPTLEKFKEWLKKRPNPILVDEDFNDWWNNTYTRQIRRHRRG